MGRASDFDNPRATATSRRRKLASGYPRYQPQRPFSAPQPSHSVRSITRKEEIQQFSQLQLTRPARLRLRRSWRGRLVDGRGGYLIADSGGLKPERL